VAIQMATINAAECFGMSHDLGSITPGNVLISCSSGIWLVRVRRRSWQTVGSWRRTDAMVVEFPLHDYPEYATGSVHLARPLTGDDFRIKAGLPGKRVRIRVMQVTDGQRGNETHRGGTAF